jgi:hypothetical protein
VRRRIGWCGRLGARLYAATIAAAKVRHGESISTQSPAAIQRALESLEHDTDLPPDIRNMVGLALCMMVNGE